MTPFFDPFLTPFFDPFLITLFILFIETFLLLPNKYFDGVKNKGPKNPGFLVQKTPVFWTQFLTRFFQKVKFPLQPYAKVLKMGQKPGFWGGTRIDLATLRTHLTKCWGKGGF